MSFVVQFAFLTVLTVLAHGLPTPEADPKIQLQCPLEFPLKERNGEIRRCKPIGSPFCPDTHFCKIETQSDAGVCCPKNVLGKIQETETENNKAKAIQGETETTPNPVNPNCHPFELLPLKSPDCRYEPRKVLDSNGCPKPPTIVCTSEENDCPAISLPVLSSLCKFGPSKNGSNGCPIAPDIICEKQEIAPKPINQIDPPGPSTKGPNQPAQPPSAQQQNPPQPFSGAQPPASAPGGSSPAPQAGAVQPPPTQSGPPQPPPAAGSPGNSQSSQPPPPPIQSTAPNAQSSPQTPPPQAPLQPINGSAPQQPIPPVQPSSNQQQPAINGSQQAPVKPAQPSIPVIPVLAPANSNETQQSIVNQFASSFNETTEEPPRNFTFEEMLGNDFLHALNRTEMPQPTDFRKKFGPPMNASGKFHPCKIHADCFQFREPAEWCRPKNFIRWNEKSCFCATDTMTPSCIVERTDGDKTEWTFCSSFSDLKCN